MTQAERQPIYLKDYQSPAYKTLETFLNFDLADGMTEVTARLRVERTGAAGPDVPLRLDGEDLELVSVAVNGAFLSSNQYQRDEKSLTLFGLPATAEITLVTRIYPEQNTALEGLYRSGSMYCTQCEAEGFRRITYYQDRPDVLSRFATTLVADGERYPVMLANGNLVADETLADGRRSVTWHDPFPKPSYLFAMVAGDLAVLEDQFVTASGRQVVLRIYSEPHNIGQCRFAMGALKRAMAWDEAKFGREYDLDIFMIVAVEDFNMGAMENKGLNIFNTSAVLAAPDTATDAAYQRVEAIVAHEYFHNWSGNRVTCRDWFQLSLKEGFTVYRDAEFTSDMHARPVKRIEDVTLLRSVQFAEDAGPLAHPVRPDSYIEISNFYTPTVYEKGSEVVGMLHGLLGPELFRQGSDLYFERHDGTAATTDDFVRAMADVSGEDLEQFQRWYEQAGTPLVAVRSSFEEADRGGELRLILSQSCPPTPGQADKAPFHMPIQIGLLDDKGDELVSPRLSIDSDEPVQIRTDPETGVSNLLLQLRSARAELVVSELDQRPVVSFLRGFSAPVRVDYPRDHDELAFLALHDSDGFARWDALQTLVVAEIQRLHEASGPSDRIVALFGSLVESALASTEEAGICGLLATIFTLPDENYLFEQLSTVDVDAVCNASDRLREQLARAHAESWLALYERNRPLGAFKPAPLDMARRSLKHAALTFVASAAEAEAAESLLGDHYDAADNLTDRRGALVQITRLAHIGDEFRQRVLNDFFARWQDESLVVNLWFALQAASPLSGVEQLRELATHPAFDAHNPNKLRALYGSFANQNHRNFHNLDGSGYRFLADAVIDLDWANPQVAARLTTPLTRWRRYQPDRQRLMRAELERIAGGDQLSADLFEVVTKSLA